MEHFPNIYAILSPSAPFLCPLFRGRKRWSSWLPSKRECTITNACFRQPEWEFGGAKGCRKRLRRWTKSRKGRRKRLCRRTKLRKGRRKRFCRRTKTRNDCRKRLRRWTKTRKGCRKRLCRRTKTRKGCRKRLRRWTKTKKVAGRGSADGQKRKMYGGE